MIRPTGWAFLGLVGRRSGQSHERAELPTIAQRGDEVPRGRGLGEVCVAVGEGRHIPTRHRRTARWLPAVVNRESAGKESRRRSHVTTLRQQWRERPLPSVVIRPVVTLCSAVSQSKHEGPGGATMGAATTTCPHIARYWPWSAASPAAVAWSLTRWSRPSAEQVIAVDREVVPSRIWSTVGMAEPFRDRWGLRRPRRVPPPGSFSLVEGVLWLLRQWLAIMPSDQNLTHMS